MPSVTGQDVCVPFADVCRAFWCIFDVFCKLLLWFLPEICSTAMVCNKLILFSMNEVKPEILKTTETAWWGSLKLKLLRIILLGSIGDLNIDCSLSLNRHSLSVFGTRLRSLFLKFVTEYLRLCIGRATIYNPFCINDRVLLTCSLHLTARISKLCPCVYAIVVYIYIYV